MTDSAAALTLDATVTRAGLPDLCARLAATLHGRPGGVVTCDVSAARPDLVTVEALARLHLTARRHGWRLLVGSPGADLRRLIRLAGLAGTLAEVGGQPEQREQPGRVEEVVHPGDPPA